MPKRLFFLAETLVVSGTAADESVRVTREWTGTDRKSLKVTASKTQESREVRHREQLWSIWDVNSGSLLDRVVMRYLAGIFALTIAGCSGPADTMHPISPEDAKEAVIKLIRDRPHEFVGSPDPETLRPLALTEAGNDSWVFGAFTVCPTERRYSAIIDEGPANSFHYDGELITMDGTAIALRPSVTRYHAGIEDTEY